MPFFHNLLEMFTNAEDIRDKYTGISITEILAWIAEETELRFYVDGTPNFGHQASTIHLMKRLIDETQFKGSIKVVYAQEELTNTPQKLAILLAGLNPEKIDTTKIAYGSCKNITFLKYENISKLEDEVKFAFTGGADDMSVNYAIKLNATYFLRLQPYLWGDPMSDREGNEYWETSRVEKKDGKFFYMPEAYENFLDLAYKFSKDKFTSVADEVWQWYEDSQSFDTALKTRTKNIHSIYAQYQTNTSICLWPLYGLHQFYEQLPSMALNFVLTAFEVQKTVKKPIVTFSMNKPEGVWERLLTYLPALSKDINSKDVELTELKAALKENYQDESDAARLASFVQQLIINIMPLIEADSKLTLLEGDQDISKELSSAIGNASNNEVIVALIGPVPVDIYNYFYANSKFPGVFEGQGTSSLVISLGRPFLQLTRKDSGIDNNYPSTLSAKDFSKVSNSANSAALKIIDLQCSNYITEEEDPTLYYPGIKIIADFINASLDTSTQIFCYFNGLGVYYQKNIHDKFMLGLVALDSLILGFDRVQVMLARALVGSNALEIKEKSKLTLNDIYNRLIQNYNDGGISLETALPQTYLTNFFSKVVGDKFFISVDKNNIVAEKEGDLITKVTLSGGATSAFSSIQIPSFDIKLEFTAKNGPVVTEITASVNKVWNILGVPWIGFENPGFFMKVNEGRLPVQGGLTGTIKGTDLDLEIVYPTVDDTWLIKGSFEKDYPSVDRFYQMAGGINLVQSLPSPLSEMSGFGLKNTQLMYSKKSSQFTYMSFEMTTQSPWTISNTPLFQIKPTVIVSISNIQDVSNRKTMVLVSGSFTIGKGTITVNGSYPNFELYGGLSRGKIMLSDLLSLFGGELKLTTAVTQFSFAYKPDKKYYKIAAKLEDDKPLNILSLLSIKSLSFYVESSNDTKKVALGGVCTILPDTSKIDIRVLAQYTSGDGWVFIGKQTSGEVSLSALLKKYLGWDTGQMLGINGLSITIKAKTKSYEFSGKTAEPWKITPLNLSITANVTIGHRSDSQENAFVTLKTSKAEMPALIQAEKTTQLPVLASSEKTSGSYGEVGAEIVWNNIDLLISYNFDPAVKKFQVTWGILTGSIEEKQIKGKKHQIAELHFTRSTTLGSMIEIMVSWATGSKFSLSAPWNVLDKIPLSSFILVWDFTDNTVSIKVNIGPIDLGFVTIKSIGLSYEKSDKNASEKSVMIDLDASFVWGDKIPKWDATKPETTPSPQGSGNKYLDLRLLAMGQHITFAGFKDADTVQKAIATMADMPEPKPDTIPAITFDADSSWLFGADFGVLRIDDKKKGGNNGEESDSKALVAANDGGAKYVLTLQTVFNDPNLYALRIALDGDAAKMFKGLDFQILYRKLSDDLGVYKSEITLPDVMRHLSVGAYSITLPVFGIEIYSNGDFKVDIGFPWNEDFSRSFSVEAIVPPGIPLLGSGGIYFGKIPQVTANVPAATNGHFNPIMVFGFGAQVGLGKSIEYGILRAGFSLTVFGIIEGLLAKWNPYDGKSTGDSNSLQLQGEYFFRLQGTFGLIGKIYGSIDFVIIKADVNITVKAYAQITFASYEPIPITLAASVEASASIKIDLGLFSIHIHFSFSVRVKETFVIGSLQNPDDAPWKVESKVGAGRLEAPLADRLRDHPVMLMAFPETAVTPNWSRLSKPETPAPLDGYLSYALTVAGDNAFAGGTPDTSKQIPCYISSLFVKSVPAASEDDNTSTLKAEGKVADTPFETLAKLVGQWAVASIQNKDATPAQVNGLIITEDELEGLLAYLSASKERPVPLPAETIETFLANQLRFSVSLPDKDAKGGKENAAFFPMALPLEFTRDAYGSTPKLNYTYNAYNTIDTDFIGWLRDYFDQLAVQVAQEEGSNKGQPFAMASEGDTSVAEFVFSDYFLIIMRHMLQSMKEGLRSFKYQITSGEDVIEWVNNTGQLNGQFSLNDLFEGNKDHLLNTGKAIAVTGASYPVQAGDSFESIAVKDQFGKSFDATGLAEANADVPNLLKTGAKITWSDKPDYTVTASETLTAVAKNGFNATLEELLTNSNVLSAEDVLAQFTMLSIPEFSYTSSDGDKLSNIASFYGVDVKSLSLPAGDKAIDLFSDEKDPYLNLVHLPQFQVGELIKELQRSKSIEQLSGMVSRYYLHGLRLPTEKITPKKEGMWVTRKKSGELILPEFAGLFALTGQQFSIPKLDKDDLTITLTRSDSMKWLNFANGSNTLVFTVTTKDTDPDYQRIQKLQQYALTNVLDTGLTAIGPEVMVHNDLSVYPLSSSIPCQIATAVTYPIGGVVDSELPPRLWYIPSSMRSLPKVEAEGSDNYPVFELQTHSYNQASGTLDRADVQHYGWATAVEFSIKRLSHEQGDSAYDNTYEIMGASGETALILERMTRVGSAMDNACALLTLAYDPSGASKSNSGGNSALRIVTGAGITMGLSQANLSTVTRPSAKMMFAMAEAPPEKITLLNSASQFVKLLWEASITRAGGFYLYFNEKDVGGLPEQIFNDKGEADVTLMVMYNTAPPANALRSYMNAALIGDPMSTSASTLAAQAVSTHQSINLQTDVTPASFVGRYYSTLVSLIENNASIMLSQNADYTISNATYMVTSAGTAPGGDLDKISAYFAMSEDDIKAANPRISDGQWNTGLNDGTVIRLPNISRTVGVSPGGSSLQDISKFYGTTPAAILGYNKDIVGLIEPQQTLSLDTGPYSVSGETQIGVQAIGATRKGLPDIPSITDSNYAKDYLLYLYTMLGYRIIQNQDFIASNIGLPLGPKGKSGSGEGDKIRFVRQNTEQDSLDYSKGLPYVNLIVGSNGQPEKVDNPYQANGRLLQLDYSWDDIYGNRLVTDLDEGTKIGGRNPDAPILTGYTDPIVGLAQWPSVSSHWTVVADTNNNDNYLLVTTLSFDPSAYLPPKQGDSDSWKTRAKVALATYKKVLLQLTDPNGIEFIFSTNLSTSNVTVPDDQIGNLGSPDTTLVGWLAEIANFLQGQIGGTPSNEKKSSYLSLSASAAKSDLNKEQIFLLNFEFIIHRSSGVAQGDFSAIPGVRQIVTQVTPCTSIKVDGKDVNGGGDSKPGLDQFAKDIEDTLSETGKYVLTVGVGENRQKADVTSDNNTVWAIRLGDSISEKISFQINEFDPTSKKGTPQIFAPRPVSNTLETKPNVSIRNYDSLDDFDPENNELIGTEKSLNFADVDLDNWVRQLFNSVDNLLSPEYLSSMLILDNYSGIHPEGVTSFLESLNTQKKQLAAIGKELASPVFKVQERSLIDSAKETLHQKLLDKLSSLYSTKAIVSYSAKVNANKLSESPQLYGSVTFNGKVIENSKVVLTSPKLELTPSDDVPLSFVIETPSLLKSGSSGVVPSLPLDLIYDGSNIEHQIDSVPGIKGYKASSWLSLVRTETMQKLQAQLGSFEVPMFIRAFPSTPRMDFQTGTPFEDAQANSLSSLISWDYSFTYSMDYHYAQDRVYGVVEYNLNIPDGVSLSTFDDAFQPLAQYIAAKKKLDGFIKQYVPVINAETSDRSNIDNAAKVLGAYLKMITDIATMAGSSGTFFAQMRQPGLVGDSTLSYAFIIEEGEYTIKEGSAWIVKIVSADGEPPVGLLPGHRPAIDLNVPGITANEVPDKNSVVGTDWEKGVYAYWYSKDQKPVTGDMAQEIQDRTMVIPGLNILARQDAKSTVYLKRNEELVAGKPSADAFIYQTPKVSFTNPLLPTVDRYKPFDMTTVKPSLDTKPMADWLSEFFSALFEKSAKGTKTIQTECQYAYEIVKGIDEVRLPVLMIPPIMVDPETDFTIPKGGCSGKGSQQPFVCRLADSIQGWYVKNKPVTNSARFYFDITVMSDMTEKSMPLIRLRRTYLEVKDIKISQ